MILEVDNRVLAVATALSVACVLMILKSFINWMNDNPDGDWKWMITVFLFVLAILLLSTPVTN